MVVFLLQSSESSIDFRLLIGLEESRRWSELDLVFVFIRHFPLVLQRNSRVVLHKDRLLRGNSDISWREEKFLLVAQLQLGLVAVTNQIDFVHV